MFVVDVSNVTACIYLLRLGSVKIWDLRQGNTPAAILAPAEGEPTIDPWTVSFGTTTTISH